MTSKQMKGFLEELEAEQQAKKPGQVGRIQSRALEGGMIGGALLIAPIFPVPAAGMATGVAAEFARRRRKGEFVSGKKK